MHIPHLQALRACAALLVLLFHARLAMGHHPDLAVLKNWFHFGFIGVDVFFVLSGFVVGMSAEAIKDSASFKNFGLKRLGRIYLGYWPIFACAVLVWQLSPVDLKLNNAYFWPSVFLLEPNLFKNWLIVAWSLTYELYFYFLIAVAHFLGHAKRLILIFCGLLLGLHLYWQAQLGAAYSHGTPFMFLLSPYCLSFFAGYAVLTRYQTTGANRHWLWVGALLAGVGLAIGTRYPLCNDVPLYRVFSFGMFGVGALIFTLGIAATTHAPKVLVVMGDASYSLYLWHTVLLQIGAYGIGRLLPTYHTTALMLALSLPLLCVLLTTLWYQRIEWPLYKKYLAYFATN